MAKTAPFPGFRYNPKKVGDLAQVVAPPYDVIDSTLQDRLFGRSPYNVVRVDLAKDEGPVSRYEIAGKNFAKWKEQEVLIQDSQPAIYLYFQTYSLPNGERKTRKGFLARRRLESFEEGGVKPHERTFPGPKADRLQLMHATQANLSPIFGLFSDPKGEVEVLLQKFSQATPEIQIKEENGDEHRLWKVDRGADIAEVLELVQDRPLLIADGHHRYETALNYRDERKALLGEKYTGEEPFNFVLMYFCSLQDPGLVVLPTHRVLTQSPDMDPAILRSLLEKYATFKSFAYSEADAALRWMESEGGREHVLGWVHAGQIDVLSFDAEKILNSPSLNHLHFVLRDLDVTILHDLVLEEIFGLAKGAQREYGAIEYIKDAREALRIAEQKKTHAFLMNATKLKQIEAVTEIGEKMPQKSTFFYPKLLTGLVFHELK